MFIPQFVLGVIVGIVGVCVVAVIYSQYKK